MRQRIHTGSRWLIALSVIAMSLSGFVSNQLFDEDAFASLISSSLDNSEVRELLADKAIDVAIDASNADVLLADALPEEIALAATPALELTKPALAEAGAALLGIDTVGSSIEAAARSVHRQTASSIAATTNTEVVLNARPVLVVVASEVAGDIGARAAVGIDLPDSATSISLGSNQNAMWSVLRSVSYVAAASFVVWLFAMAAFFGSARRGHRLAAARRLAKTLIRAGIAVTLIGWIALIVTAVALEAVLSPGAALSFGGFSFGGSSFGGGAALAEILLAPLQSSARRTVVTGIAIIAATYVFGSGAVAIALRRSVRSRTVVPLLEAIEHALPRYVRHTQRAISGALLALLLLWPGITLRVALTVCATAVLAHLALWLLTSNRPPAASARSLFEVSQVPRLDLTERSDKASRRRIWLLVVAPVVAVLWPSYDRAGFVGLAVVVAAAFAATFVWELRPADAAEELAAASLITEGAWSIRRKLVVAGIVAAGIGFIALGGDNSNPAGATAFGVGGPSECNGQAVLCDVPLDQVAFAGTHNSMSASSLGWELANHEGAIPAQLEAGVRALLIDVQYWPQSESIGGLDLDPEAARIAADALLIEQAPEDGLWMCHNLCQLGGTPFSDFLADLRVFLETNRDEVVIVVIQDDAPATDIKEAIVRAEIDMFAYAHEPDTRWPTLAGMIERNERVVFMAENNADADGWYQLAFDGNVSETGFRYSVLEDFDCAESRGGNDGDLFLINHWVETGLPVPEEADRVNATAELQQRYLECIDQRSRRPGIIAVNFWERGDLLSFIDGLNLETHGGT